MGGLLLSIGLAIFNFSFKELILASTAKESQISFFAADAGTECALFHDQQNSAFNTSNPATAIVCGEQTVGVTTGSVVRGGQAAVTRRFEWLLPDGSCTDVTVYKFTSANRTEIDSRGFNVACDSDSPRKTERAIRVIYGGL